MSALSCIQIRRAILDDLPFIHLLIKESYNAMNDHNPELHVMWASGAQKAIDEGDLKESNFSTEYLSRPTQNGFWVACNNDMIVGCVGLKRNQSDDGELVRMSVTSSQRGKNIGYLLVQALNEFVFSSHCLRITLGTANPTAANFYKKCGFVSISETQFTVTQPMVATLNVFSMVKYFGERLIRNVCVIGGR